MDRRRAIWLAKKALWLSAASLLFTWSWKPHNLRAETSAQTKKPLAGYGQVPSDDPTAPQTASGKNGAIASAHPAASQAGLVMLRAGGNAIDAAVAASFAISVVRPQSTGLAGGGFLLFHKAKASPADVLVYDFRERAPAKASRNMYLDAQGNPRNGTFLGQTVPNASVNGHLAVGVPGLVAGLVDIHKAHGRLPLKQVLEPAIKLARDGFEVYSDLEVAIQRRLDVMKLFPATRRIFLPKGKALKNGQKLVQSDLAWTLKEIAKTGKESFYRGNVAKKLLAEMKRGGGLITAQDLSTYAVKKRRPVVGTYRGFTIASMPPPSSGGTHIVQMLNILENTNYGQLEHSSAKAQHILAETMRLAFADRAKYLGDPDFVDIPQKGLVSKAYAQKLWQRIKMNKATPSKNMPALDPQGFESDSTTHLSVIDRFGNAVSTTQTINYTFGSCVVAEGTGMVLNDEMDDFSKKPGVPNAYGLVGSEANAIAARKTMLSSMSPTIVFDQNKNVELVLGSPGGPRIITAVLQTIINYVDFRMPLPKAVQSSRIHHQWIPDILRVEKQGLTAAKSMKRLGHNVVNRGTMGDVQAIGRTANGWIGVSDKRSTGEPMAY